MGGVIYQNVHNFMRNINIKESSVFSCGGRECEFYSRHGGYFTKSAVYLLILVKLQFSVKLLIVAPKFFSRGTMV